MVDKEISAEDLAIMAAVKAAVKQGEKVKSQDLLHSWENACQCCYGEGKSQNLTEWDGETYIDEQQDMNSAAADLPITEADKQAMARAKQLCEQTKNLSEEEILAAWQRASAGCCGEGQMVHHNWGLDYTLTDELADVSEQEAQLAEQDRAEVEELAQAEAETGYNYAALKQLISDELHKNVQAEESKRKH